MAAGRISWPSSNMLSTADWKFDHCEGFQCENRLAYDHSQTGIVRLYNLDDFSAMKTYLLTSSSSIELFGVKLLQESRSNSAVQSVRDSWSLEIADADEIMGLGALLLSQND